MLINKNLVTDFFSWLFVILFLIIGLLNYQYIHPIPGTFYVLVAILFIPPLNNYFKEKVGIAIPFIFKLIVALLILWATLAVGDLAELYGF